MNKKVLIISPYFAPEQSVASIRFTKIGKYLSMMGYEIDVICADEDEPLQIDNELNRELRYFNSVERLKYPKMYYWLLNMYSKKNMTIKKDQETSEKNSISKDVFIRLSYEVNYIFDLLLANRIFKHLKKKKIDDYQAIITTYTPLASHLVGLKLKKEKFKATWIADYRDNFFAHKVVRLIPNHIKMKNSEVLNNADHIVTVGKSGIADLLLECDLSREELGSKLFVIGNGFDGEIKTNANCKTHLQICYCGTIYSTDNNKYNNYPKLLFSALSSLKKQGLIKSRDIRFVYAGKMNSQIDSYAKKENISEYVETLGWQKRENSFKIQEASDVILVSVWNFKEFQGVLGGKFYESMAFNKLLLCTVNGPLPNSEMKQIVDSHHLGYCFEEANPNVQDEIEKCLLALIEEKKNTGHISLLPHRNVKEFTHENLAKEYAKIIG